jgi:hypothetical protein
MASIAERIIFVTIAHIFHRFDLSFDDMCEETGRVDGLLKLFPPKSSCGLRVRVAVAGKGNEVLL